MWWEYGLALGWALTVYFSKYAFSLWAPGASSQVSDWVWVLAAGMSLSYGLGMVFAGRAVYGFLRGSASRRTAVEPERLRVAVVGAGFSGIGAAVRLKQAGIPFVVYDKATKVGGTWWHNQYPGCACDIVSHLYSFSFEPYPHFSCVYPKQPEIQRYLEHVVEKYGLAPYMQLGREVESAEYNETTCLWTLRFCDGSSTTAHVVLSGVGALHKPNMAGIPHETFRGRIVHTAEWDSSFDFAGKRVAVVGSGASAVQVVPELTKVAAQVTVFQRTANWLAPRFDQPYKPWQHALFRRVPFVLRLLRWFYYVVQESYYHFTFADPDRFTAKMTRRLFSARLKKACRGDETLYKQMLPSYAPGCKRILVHNDYLRALGSKRAKLVPFGVKELRDHCVVAADGTEVEVDVVVMATGFELLHNMPPIFGRGGQDLCALWKDGEEPLSNLGITVPGYPNLFVLLGPSTGLGHNSVVWMIECQINYVMQLIDEMLRRNAAEVEVKPQVARAFLDRISADLKRRVWVRGGCQSWYKTASGVVFALWPGPTYTYWWHTLHPIFSDYTFKKLSKK